MITLTLFLKSVSVTNSSLARLSHENRLKKITAFFGQPYQRLFIFYDFFTSTMQKNLLKLISKKIKKMGTAIENKIFNNIFNRWAPKSGWRISNSYWIIRLIFFYFLLAGWAKSNKKFSRNIISSILNFYKTHEGDETLFPRF